MKLEEYKEIDMRFTGGEWIDDELQAALDMLTTNKHRATVMRLAEASAIGRSMEDTFKLKEVCSKKTWHGPSVNGAQLPGWKDDPKVQRALTLARARVSSFQNAAIASNIEEATRLLAQYAPVAVMVLSVLMETADSDDVKRKAANDLLDRLDKLLGSQGSRMTLSETRTVTFDLSEIPVEALYDIVDGR